jgi:hypothetical protein
MLKKARGIKGLAFFVQPKLKNNLPATARLHRVVTKKIICYICSMSRNYKFHNPEGVFFVSFAVVECIDVFTRNVYKNILIESLAFCQRGLLWLNRDFASLKPHDAIVR